MAKFSTAFILVAPQMGENIGAAARAMLNFGVTDLRIVAPRDGWPNQSAIDNSAGALEEMNAKIFKTLQEAATDIHYLFATTARPRYVAKPVFTANEAAKETFLRARKKQKTGFVFGPERAGLTNDDLALCHAVLTIPTNPDFPCLNLGQSAVVMAYELFRAAKTKPAAQKIKKEKSPPAAHGTIDAALRRLEEELEKNGFFETETLKPVMKRNIRAMLMRAEWSEQETRTFQGIITALTGQKRKKKAAR